MKEIRKKTITDLKPFGISVIETLPELDMPNIRSPKDVGKRALLIQALLANFYGFSTEKIRKWLEKEKLIDDLTHEEKNVIDGVADKPIEGIEFYHESLYILLWYLGKQSDVPFLQESPDLLHSLPNLKIGESSELFFATTKIRNQEILSTWLDRYYCLDWACVNTNISQGVFKIDSGIVHYRRLGLEWIYDKRQEWGQIFMDT